MGLTIVLEVQTTCSVYDCVWKYARFLYFLFLILISDSFDNVSNKNSFRFVLKQKEKEETNKLISDLTYG